MQAKEDMSSINKTGMEMTWLDQISPSNGHPHSPHRVVEMLSSEKHDTEVAKNNNEASLAAAETNRKIIFPESTVPPQEKMTKLKKRLMAVIMVSLISFFLVGNSYIFKIVTALFQTNIHEILLIGGMNNILLSAIGIIIFKIPFLSHDSYETKLIFVRSIALVTDAICWYFSLLGISVSLASVVNTLLPVVTSILERIFFKVIIHLSDIICIVCGGIGLILVCKQPAAIFGTNENTDQMYYIYILLVFIAVLGLSTTGLISREMKGNTNFFDVSLYYGIALTSIEFFIIYFWNIKCVFDVTKFFSFMGMHCFTYLTYFVFHYAHKYTSATNVSFNGFAQALLSVIIDVILGLQMDSFMISGTTVLILSGLALTIVKVVREQTKSSEVSVVKNISNQARRHTIQPKAIPLEFLNSNN